jgi:hypothetical protein
VLGGSVIDAGIAPGEMITVDESDETVRSITERNVVLVKMGSGQIKVLRQFVSPNLLVTNRPGANIAIKTSGSCRPKTDVQPHQRPLYSRLSQAPQIRDRQSTAFLGGSVLANNRDPRGGHAGTAASFRRPFGNPDVVGRWRMDRDI